MSIDIKFFHLRQSMEPDSDAQKFVYAFPVFDDNYEKVVEALKKRFGDEEKLVEYYVRELLKLVTTNATRTEKHQIKLKNLHLELSGHLAALQTLKLQNADPSTWLMPLVLACVPDRVIYSWENSGIADQISSQVNPTQSKLDLFMTFLDKQVNIRQKIEANRNFVADQKPKDKAVDKSSKTTSKDRQSERGKLSTLSSMHVGDVHSCLFCDRSNHSTADCIDKTLDHDAKVAALKKQNLCFNCCSARHFKRECYKETNVKCKRQGCGGKHATSMCLGLKRKRSEHDSPTKRPRMDKDFATVTTSSNSEECDEVSLQIALLKVKKGTKSEIGRVFIDSGSMYSYMSTRFIERMKLKPSGKPVRVQHRLFGDNITAPMYHNRYWVNISSVDGSYNGRIRVRGFDKICGSMVCIADRHPDIYQALAQKGINLSDDGSHSDQIDLLIGADWIGAISTGEEVPLESGAVAIKTKLGWTLLGNIGSSRHWQNAETSSVSMAIADTCLARLWELDVLGISDPFHLHNDSETERALLDKFREKITRENDGRYTVHFPWKEQKSVLPNNREVAIKRLYSTSKKLLQLNLFDTYSQLLLDWEAEGFIERVPENERGSGKRPCHYIPHRAVIKQSLTTPVRPVFDASCRMGKYPSLNDILCKGANFILRIPELMHKFRRKLYAFIADIRKAFQQIGVAVEDRDVMRFLWWLDSTMNELVEWRHTRVMFGATCSPYILGAVLCHHLTNLPEEERELGMKLLASMYVDNCVGSEDTVEEYHEFRAKATEFLARAKMDLRMWMSNVDGFENEETWIISVLGLLWDRKKDELFVNVKDIAIPEKITKRTVLSTVQKVYDPIGFVCPAILPMKILLQKTWLQNLKWDDPLREQEATMFRQWCDELHILGEIRVPRLVTNGVSNTENWSFHTFVDASKDAYGAVVFLRVHDGNAVYIQLLDARSRLAPVEKKKPGQADKPEKRMTIPKLELMGCLIGARLLASVKKAWDIVNVPEYYWCDSTTALAWIKREHSWGTFVANRARDIRALTNITDWHHIPGEHNPADLPSRGVFPAELLRRKWTDGPTWLYQDESLWPRKEAPVNEEEIMAELKKSVPRPAVISFAILDFQKKDYSSFKAIRFIGWYRRFVDYRVHKKDIRRGELTIPERDIAEKIFIRSIQREEFPEHERDQLKFLRYKEDKLGVLRVETRLTYRKDHEAFKFPMILPSHRSEVRRLIMDYHVMYCHAGVGILMSKLREKFWILKARRTIKAVITKCVKCQRYLSDMVTPPPAPLPLDRVKDAQVFEVTGVDLAGPLILRGKAEQKVWIVLFTCAVYRAVHMELVGSLTTQAFIRVLGKFIRKYRRPEIIYSDIGTNFRGTANLFKKIDWTLVKRDYQLRPIEFKFIPSLSPWWGGWWERIIRSTKDLLKRTVGNKQLNWEELEIIVFKLADVLNDRPLTYVSENPDDLTPLTPAMFLNPLGKAQFPEGELTEAERMRVRWSYMQTLQAELKTRFRTEYLAYLVSTNPKKAVRNLEAGELVFVGSDGTKRMDWPLGRIVEMLPGGDGISRRARVKTANGEIIRTVQRLFPLELDTCEPMEEEVRNVGIKTRSGREVKRPIRFQK